MQRDRFFVRMRERKLRDGLMDRFYCVLDRQQRNFLVFRVCAVYPDAEAVARDYAAQLNSMENCEIA